MRSLPVGDEIREHRLRRTELFHDEHDVVADGVVEAIAGLVRRLIHRGTKSPPSESAACPGACRLPAQRRRRRTACAPSRQPAARAGAPPHIRDWPSRRRPRRCRRRERRRCRRAPDRRGSRAARGSRHTPGSRSEGSGPTPAYADAPPTDAGAGTSWRRDGHCRP